MHGLSGEDLLRVWEAGARERSSERALLLLGAMLRDQSREDLAQLGIGQRDAWLLMLRARTFGDRMEGFAECPACGERLEFEVSAAQVLSVVDDDFLVQKPTTETIEIDGHSIDLRLPNTSDLLAVSDLLDEEAVISQILERCVMRIERAGVMMRLADLSPAILERIDAWMNAKDPLAEVGISLVCAVCQHTWDVVLDIVGFLWSDVKLGAKRLLREVHVLAREYGWSERDVLGLSPWRRQAYLNLLGEA